MVYVSLRESSLNNCLLQRVSSREYEVVKVIDDFDIVMEPLFRQVPELMFLNVR